MIEFEENYNLFGTICQDFWCELRVFNVLKLFVKRNKNKKFHTAENIKIRMIPNLSTPKMIPNEWYRNPMILFLYVFKL